MPILIFSLKSSWPRFSAKCLILLFWDNLDPLIMASIIYLIYCPHIHRLNPRFIPHIVESSPNKVLDPLHASFHTLQNNFIMKEES